MPYSRFIHFGPLHILQWMYIIPSGLLIERRTRDWPRLAAIESETVQNHIGVIVPHVAGAAAVLCTRLEFSKAGGLERGDFMLR